MKATVSALSRHAAELEIQNRQKELEIKRLKKQQSVKATCAQKEKIDAAMASAVPAAFAASVASTLAPPLPRAESSAAKQAALKATEQEQLSRARNFAKDRSTFQSKLCRKRLGEMVLQNITLKLGETHLTVIPGSMLSYFFRDTNYDLKTVFKVRGDETSFEVLFIDGTTERFTPRQPSTDSDFKASSTHLSPKDIAQLMRAVKDGSLTQEQVLTCTQNALPVPVVLAKQETHVMSLWRQFLMSRLLHLWGTENVVISPPNRIGLWDGTNLLLEAEAKKRAAARTERREKALEFGSKIFSKLLEVEEGKERHTSVLQMSALLVKAKTCIGASQCQGFQDRIDAMRKNPDAFTVVHHKQLLAELEALLK